MAGPAPRDRRGGTAKNVQPHVVWGHVSHDLSLLRSSSYDASSGEPGIDAAIKKALENGLNLIDSDSLTISEASPSSTTSEERPDLADRLRRAYGGHAASSREEGGGEVRTLKAVIEAASATEDPDRKATREVAKKQATWSVGSDKHAQNECKPCAWYWRTSGCNNGDECIFCHTCENDALKSRKKEKIARLKAAKRQAGIILSL
mmetsp:Transcript_69953/g.198258  ORF Transcript_69953/g.198258 Transcript_69953/m.198258 type:complete len:205 (-) Transcript_69953:37-651(-)|eukprot:CAMPEP_0168421668 /NCGR_PEP_ID=MMETSP0228-20121227/33399_1 /TAXON_ID=133427 /ORGANISM="Protoceratium reticulatum, Strain CCCM 535 (=CCMP 1889)" /LENGTH=204 /DNA_ID=CAMNT_0008435581 /DNA_START=86 /DNA_END=700 /DNA_ORIENTATION=+